MPAILPTLGPDNKKGYLLRIQGLLRLQAAIRITPEPPDQRGKFPANNLGP
jgi:hypothetical protein